MAILAVGLWPRGGPPPNGAHFDAARGLVLEAPGQLVHDEPVRLAAGAFTLEAWLVPAVPRAPGANQEVLSLVDARPVPPLLLGTWPSGTLLRLRRDNPGGLPSADRYARWGAERARVHVAVVADPAGTRLYHDGRRVKAFPTPAPPAGEALAGRWVLGSSGRGWPAWAGAIEAVALHERALDEATLGRHAAIAPTALEGVLASEAPAASAVFVGLDGPPAGWRLPARVDDAWPTPLAWRFDLSRDGGWLLRDGFLNLLFFAPLGALLAWGRPRGWAWRVLVAAGVLSLAIELAQFLLPGRSSSALDLAANVAGALLGGGIVRAVGAARARRHAARATS